eukprot:Hpha_TRINITY_DN30232_c0_g1::TRINITY_DN30232_c0_g1_i1::g.27069::m.27069
MEVGGFTSAGDRYGLLNQDAHALRVVQLEGVEVAVLVVADGHGICGEKVAVAAAEKALEALVTDQAALQRAVCRRGRLSERLRRYYTIHNKDKLADLDKMVDTYMGKEAALFTALASKYGEEPPGDLPAEAMLRATFREAQRAALEAARSLPDTHEFQGRTYTLETDAEEGLVWAADQGRAPAECGATLAIALIAVPSEGCGDVWAANAGDCGVVLCREDETRGYKGVLLTTPHTAKDPLEAARVKESQDGRLEEDAGGPRVVLSA